MSRYDDIIDRPRPVSGTRPRMDPAARAAQFAPFAALTGFGAVITETARATDERIELDEGGREALDARLRALSERLGERPEIAATYFEPDGRKPGGAYVTVRGAAKKLDLYGRRLVLADGTDVALDELYALTGEIFDEM